MSKVNKKALDQYHEYVQSMQYNLKDTHSSVPLLNFQHRQQAQAQKTWFQHCFNHLYRLVI